jgi:hypothetical protein
MRLVPIALVVTLTGCAARQGVKRVWVNAWALGAFGGGDVDMRDLCASGKAREVSVGASWSTLGISVVTLGVYTPREVKVTCVPAR